MLFKQLAVGQKFKVQNDDNVYLKIKAEKISCCKTVVAQKITSNEKVQLNQDLEVELVEE